MIYSNDFPERVLYLKKKFLYRKKIYPKVGQELNFVLKSEFEDGEKTESIEDVTILDTFDFSKKNRPIHFKKTYFFQNSEQNYPA